MFVNNLSRKEQTSEVTIDMKINIEPVKLNDNMETLCWGCFELLDASQSHVSTQCPRMDLSKRFLPKPMTTTG